MGQIVIKKYIFRKWQKQLAVVIRLSGEISEILERKQIGLFKKPLKIVPVMGYITF